MRLKKHGPREALGNGENGGVKALKVAGLDDATGIFGTDDEVVGFGEICGQGFFDKQVDAGVEEQSGDGVMMDGGHGNAGCVEIQVGGEEFFD
jgi:hypothetical protein